MRVELSGDSDQRLSRLRQTTMDLQADDRAKLYAAHDDMYDMNVGRSPQDVDIVQSEREKVVQRIFLWTLCAHRPFRLHELLEAVSVNGDGSKLDGIDEEYLLDKGSNFIRQDVQRRIVFTHLSVREYLSNSAYPKSMTRFAMDREEMNAIAASRSLQQLSLRAPDLKDWEVLHHTIGSGQSLFSYCCTYWPQHVRAAKGSFHRHQLGHKLLIYGNVLKQQISIPSIDEFIEKLIDYMSLERTTDDEMDHTFLLGSDASRLHDSALRVMEAARQPRWTRSTWQEPDTNWLDLAVVQCLVASSTFPLESYNGFTEIAIESDDALLELLLYYGSPVDAACKSAHTNLHLAAMFGSRESMRMLLASPSSTKLLVSIDVNGRMPIDLALVEHSLGAAGVLWSAMMEDMEDHISDSTANLYMSSLGFERDHLQSNKRRHFLLVDYQLEIQR